MNIVRSPKTLTRALSVAAGKTAAERYASNSVLSQGRWVKIGITEDGVYRLTAADLRRMGFNDPSRVKLYGYGGHVQDEVIDADTDFDDLEEVPLYRDERGLLFFGKGLISWSATDRRGRATHRVNTFAKQACYFLTEGDSPRTIEKQPCPALHRRIWITRRQMYCIRKKNTHGTSRGVTFTSLPITPLLIRVLISCRLWIPLRLRVVP